MNGLRVSRTLTIPRAEIDTVFTTSGGPGGQHANRSSTKVELVWNVDDSAVLSEQQRRRIRARLKTRIDQGGDLRVASSEHRSQSRNREEAEQRMVKLISGALRVPKTRVPTGPSRAAKQRRLDEKKKRSETKKARRKPEL